MKQQIDALSVESISRLLTDIKNWLKLPEQEVKISNRDSHNKYFNTKYAADELIVDPIHELLLCRTVNGVYVDIFIWN